VSCTHAIYLQSSSDLPLLVNIRNLAKRLLTSLLPPSSPASTGQTTPSTSTNSPLQHGDSEFRIGFITPPFKDNKIPVTDHLHAHAYIAPADLMGWWRGIAYSPVAWYAIDDLIAEIRYDRLTATLCTQTDGRYCRESVSNNRVKSGYANRSHAPIDMVPSAGARMGTADGVEVTEPGLAIPDLEDGQRTPASLAPRSPHLLSPQSSIPHLRV
jgi:hypothetical protein